MLPVVQCLKTVVPCILSSVPVVDHGRLSPLVVTLSGMIVEVFVTLFCVFYNQHMLGFCEGFYRGV